MYTIGFSRSTILYLSISVWLPHKNSVEFGMVGLACVRVVAPCGCELLLEDGIKPFGLVFTNQLRELGLQCLGELGLPCPLVYGNCPKALTPACEFLCVRVHILSDAGAHNNGRRWNV
jgi:hypothetical protein